VPIGTFRVHWKELEGPWRWVYGHSLVISANRKCECVNGLLMYVVSGGKKNLLVEVPSGLGVVVKYSLILSA
jgi:hypothetical protein